MVDEPDPALDYRITASTLDPDEPYLECPDCQDVATSINPIGAALGRLLQAAREHHTAYHQDVDDGDLEDAAAAEETGTDDELLVDTPHGLDPGQVC